MMPNPDRISARFYRVAPTLIVMVAFVAGITEGISAPSSTLRNDRPSPPVAAEDGFTRESLLEFDAPEPAPLVPPSVASVQTTDAPDSGALAHHHRRVKRHHQASQNPPQVVVGKAPAHRNPVASFVYWWNGFVIKNFHTKVGTVMLGTVGAKS